MSRHVPDFINPIRAAEGGVSISGQLAFARMKRLLEIVTNPEGAADIVLDFAIDGQGTPFVHGRVRADLVLTCQRCLEAMVFPVDAEISLGIAASEEEAKRLPLQYDPVVTHGEQLSLAEVVEDEILLALPTIPRHDPAACTALENAEKRLEGVDEDDKAASNPFAVLAKLKAKR